MVTLLGQPALVQLVEKAKSNLNQKEKKDLIKKIESQLSTFDGKGKLTVDDFYSVIKIQVCLVSKQSNVFSPTDES